MAQHVTERIMRTSVYAIVAEDHERLVSPRGRKCRNILKTCGSPSGISAPGGISRLGDAQARLTRFCCAKASALLHASVHIWATRLSLDATGVKYDHSRLARLWGSTPCAFGAGLAEPPVGRR